MRNTDMLGAIQDAAKLQQWLYASEEHKITVENSFGAPIELRMDEEGSIWARNLNFPNQAAFDYDHMLSIPIWLGIIEQLQAQPPEHANAEFQSRWDEIKFETAFSRTMAATSDRGRGLPQRRKEDRKEGRPA